MQIWRTTRTARDQKRGSEASQSSDALFWLRVLLTFCCCVIISRCLRSAAYPSAIRKVTQRHQEKRFLFLTSNTRWNSVCANVGANIFPRLWNMSIHFCTSEERHFGEVDRPAIRWILQLWFTRNTRINIFARRLVMFFYSRVDLILIWIDNVLIMARIYILFNPFKKKMIALSFE